MLVFNRKKLICLYGVSVFILNSVVRGSIYQLTGITLSGLLGSINLFAIVALVGLLLLEIRSGSIYSKRVSWEVLLLIIVYVALCVNSNYNGINGKLGNWVVLASILPGMLLSATRFEQDELYNPVEKTLKIVNAIFLSLFIVGILDYFMGGVVGNFIADNLSDESWARMIRNENSTYGFRMVTLIGSPLMNAFYALVMLVLNVTYTKYTGKELIKKGILYCITGITIVLTGSRTALIFAAAFILVNEFLEKWGVARIIAIVLIFAVFVNTDLFQETVGARLKLGFNNEIYARYMLWTMFTENKFGSLQLFSGGGYNYSRSLTGSLYSYATSLNFEYPILMFAFDYGIVATILYYLIFLAAPCIKLLSEKKKFALFSYCTIFAFLQTCNISAQFYDFNLQLGFIILVLYSLPSFYGYRDMLGNE